MDEGVAKLSGRSNCHDLLGEAGSIEGDLNRVVSEKGLDTNSPVIEFEERHGCHWGDADDWG